MNPRLLRLARLIRTGLSALALVTLATFLGATVATYLAFTGRSVPVLRSVVARLGTFMEGQRTERMTLDIRVVPDTARLTGLATLTVRSIEDGRRRFYFLLNDGLRLRKVRAVDVHAPAPTAYQLGPITVVDIGSAISKDATAELIFEYDGAVAAGMLGMASSIVNPLQILLGVDAFWYPNDVQSFFTADVTVTLPSTMTVVHNGMSATRSERGAVQVVHWATDRPVAGLALVAGPYELTSTQRNGTTYRVYLPPTVHLDTGRVLEAMATADRTLAERFGPSGFKQVTFFVGQDFHRAFNDGSGMVGVALRYFRTGDYGFGITAHEIAHNWWGSTVAEKWLAPGTGGEWIVEGFAEFSSLVATEATYGRDALTRRLAGEFFDPARQGIVAAMSVLDNTMAEATARDTIYRKGAYVAFMLRHVLGDDAYFRGLRLFIERFRYQQATDHDLQQVLQEITDQDLEPYFADWVRSDKLADLSLDATSDGTVVVANLGTAVVPGKFDLWKFKKSGSDVERSTVQAGDRIPLDADVDYAVLDPQLQWADVQRENNRYPRRDDPVYVANSLRDELAIARGEAFPWVRGAVSRVDGAGRTLHTWDLTRGFGAPPSWAPDGTHIIVSYSSGDSAGPAIVTLATDGAQRTVGTGTSPAGSADGTIYAATGDRIIRIRTDGSLAPVVQRPGEALDSPLPSPDGHRLLYTAARGGRQELRVIQADGRNDRVVLSLDRDRLVSRWAPDGLHVYAIVGGDWDWEIWQVPLGDGALQTLVTSAAAITDMAVSPSGTALAFTAAPALAYPLNRRQLYIMNLGDRHVRAVDVPHADLSYLTWLGSENLLVVAAESPADEPWILPEARRLKRVRIADGSVEDVK